MMPPSFRISSYNVLVDSIYPPAWERFGILVRTLLSESARADVLVLQEVSDDFLCHLLKDDEVRSLWPLRNVVVLSRWSFDWEMVTFERRHKGAVVVKMKSVGKLTQSGSFQPLVIAGIHLTCGLTDGSVAAKKSQLRSLMTHLSGNYADFFALLETTLQQISTAGSKIPLVVVPVGSYGLGAWNVGSDIDCLCISSVSSKTFFTLAVKNLRKAAAQGVRILRKVEAHSGTMLELDIQGVKLDLQYCASANIANCWPTPLSLPPTDPLFSLPLQTLSKLKAIRDLAHLLQSTPDLPAFRAAYRFLVIWAASRGIYAARFGFLSGTHISLMLDRVAKLLYHRNGRDDVTAAHLVCTFFRYYAGFDWAEAVVEDPLTRSVPGMGRPYQRQYAGEPMVVLGYHVPRANIARAATVPAVAVLADEFRRADEAVKAWAERGGGGGLGWGSIAGDAGNGAAQFLAAYKSYVRIDVQYWGKSSVKGRQLVGWVESRCPSMLVDLSRRVPEIHARMWPMRFTRDTGNEEGDHYGCYLIGLTKRHDAEPSGKDDVDRKLALNKLDSVLERFSEQIRGNENFFDAASAWVDVKHVGRAKLEGLVVDGDDWGNDLEESWEFEDEEDEEDEVDEEAGLGEELTETMTALAAEAPAGSGASRVGKKLRPATDILNRLRWDPNLHSADYVVGYVDRFLGPREIALDRWKVEQTDEEFIPQHRILYFKRRSDGVRVWDREARLDILSGSSS
ncbi:hypothetical protein UCDDS831_g05491 [Diplodia seriata]|uniref:polynucleotide adenylyltransferase n=1 Tax=Diplodia seriata TaxID=420778 RepID=A0A0G2EAD9_9PEZI|nr:hypothetical protein UCDDS831_g05491 [Diplodia seriata]